MEKSNNKKGKSKKSQSELFKQTAKELNCDEKLDLAKVVKNLSKDKKEPK